MIKNNYMWYGKLTQNQIIHFKLLKLKHVNTQKKKLGFFFNFQCILNTTIFYFYYPSNWKCIFFKKKKIYILYFYNSIYYFIFFFNSINIDLLINRNINIIQFKLLIKNNYYELFWNNIVLIFNQFNKIFISKLKFKGKGYYIFKNKRNTITPQFGHSHRIYIYGFFVNVKFLSKTVIIVYGLNKNDVIYFSNKIFNIKPINIFTGRGIRFSKQIIYKKIGKVSTYK